MSWQPIETAPKDGRYILFTRKNPWTPNDILIGFWHVGQNIPCFVSRDGFKIDTSRWIYWMKLPELAEAIPGSREYTVLTNQGPMKIVAISLEEAKEIAKQDGHRVFDDYCCQDCCGITTCFCEDL